MSSYNVVGPQVKQARLTNKSSRITQDALAAKLQLMGWNIDRFGISKIERGERQVTDKELLLLAKALDVSAAWLLGEE
jgi:transcriptional regulator with XRE-family HTH domain